MNPGVIAPSQIPRNARHAKNPPKLVAAAWQSRAIAQTRILILATWKSCQELLTCGWTDARRMFRRDVPHPLANGEVLKREILWPFKPQEEEVKDCPEPVELRLREMVLGARPRSR